MENGKVVRFGSSINLLSLTAYCLNRSIDLPGFGELMVDVGYGGMTYVIVDAHQFGFDLHASEGRRLSDLGQEIKAAAAEQTPVSQPLNAELPGITQAMFLNPITRSSHQRCIVVKASRQGPARQPRLPRPQ
ncbi:proline racemase family protein [Mesorhizobium sp. M0954]|uniref:proline racemase family protein n=1 Tax=Mesorhizobium sp. M0954 TaxID=2957032 RepID=UPI00333A568C